MKEHNLVLRSGPQNKIHPKTFALWAACASILMMFGAFTSAYMVRQAAGNWLEFQLPGMFYISTAVIIASSLTLHLSYRAFIKEKFGLYKGLLVLTTILGIAFIALQYVGWNQLFEIGVPFRINPSGDFIYVISGVHAAHVLGGLAALIVALVHAFGLPNKVTKKRTLRLGLTMTYWHFVDILWVYLILFFALQN